MKNGFFLIILCLVCSCGKHQQSLSRVEPKQIINDVGETDETLILINAINSGDLRQVKKSIEGGKVDLTARDNQGLPLLILAIQAQQFAIVEYLIEMGVDPSLTTESDEIKPDLDAYSYIDTAAMDDEIKDILLGILKKESFDLETLAEFVYSAITFKNHFLVDWLLEKGVSPNHIRLSQSGRPKDSPLIYLFSLRGVEGEDFKMLTKVFEVLMSHPDVDVNMEVKKNTPLEKARARLKSDSAYQPLVDQLIAKGATR